MSEAVDLQFSLVETDLRKALVQAKFLAGHLDRNHPQSRNVAMTITHLEDALLRFKASEGLAP